MIADDPRKPWDYVLERECALPKEHQTVFHLRPLTVAQEMSQLDLYRRDDARRLVEEQFGTRYLRALRFGLAGWSNLKDANGAVVEFEADRSGVVTDATLERLPLGVRGELARAIEEQARSTMAEVGKSEAPST